ncbi:MAG: homoserine O-acetyltransferase, partial [Actinomycetota bacterium]|nr:homoserine O-acetyltransferase [Actinomycetota bacterium]
MTLDPRAGANQAPARPAFQLHRIGEFRSELGGTLKDVTLAYETWGELNASADNAILVAHAL